MIKQSLKREPSLYLEIRCLSTLATDFFFPISQIKSTIGSISAHRAELWIKPMTAVR
jgi:hypothetical protein